MKRFLIWLVPIVILLACIPLLLIYNVTAIAKIAGVIVVLLTTLAIRYWMFRSGNQRVYGERVKLTINERYFLNEAMPYYKVMAGSEKKVFEERIGLLLAECTFDNFDHSDVSKELCLAASAVIILLNESYAPGSWKDTIIVFRENAAPEARSQNESEVIFIDPTEIMKGLRSFSPGLSRDFLPAEYNAMLRK